MKENVADELADIMAEVLFISNELNIDFNKAWEKMIESDENKIKGDKKNEQHSRNHAYCKGRNDG